MAVAACSARPSFSSPTQWYGEWQWMVRTGWTAAVTAITAWASGVSRLKPSRLGSMPCAVSRVWAARPSGLAVGTSQIPNVVGGRSRMACTNQAGAHSSPCTCPSTSTCGPSWVPQCSAQIVRPS